MNLNRPYSVTLWFTFDRRKVVLRLVPDDTEPVPDNLPPSVSKNDDGTFSVKGRTYKSWKSAVAYLELLDRTHGSQGGS